MLKAISTLLYLLILLCPGQLIAESAIKKDDAQTVAAQIKTLEREIQQFQEMLQKTRGKQSKLEQTLETSEKQINGILNKIKKVQLKIDAGQDRLAQLLSDQRRLEQNKNEQQTLIGQQIRAAYALGQQQYMKLLLNLEEPNNLSRMLTYYDYFNRARVAQIEQHETLLRQIAAITQDIASQNKHLLVRRAQLAEQTSRLIKVRQQRQQALTLLNLEIKQTDNTLRQRLQDRRQLDALLSRINPSINNLRPPKGTELFTQRKGKLLLPVAGKLLHKFGKQRNSKLKWHGVFIAAPSGTPVQSVHHGQVVFADWLRGFGLLIIINHGQGYLSLYGHNQVLYRRVGDWIAAEEVIAAVGNSGSQTRAGLYFEIRSAGKPSDPQVWCQRRPAQNKRV